VEEADFDGRYSHWPESPPFKRFVAGGRGDHRRLSEAYIVAARRLPLRAAAVNPEPDAFIAASLPATPWHFPPAKPGRRETAEAEVQELSNWLFHIDIAEVRTAEGKLYLYVAIDRTSKFAFVQLVEKANRVTASAFLVALISACPYKIHTVLTDNGIQFRFPPRYSDGPTATYMTHMFNLRCRENGIEHRFTKINHPWTNGQVERMNRTIKEATVQRYHYETNEQLRRHLDDFVAAYNFGRRLKTLRGLTPYEFICKRWTIEPERFILNPIHQMPGLNS